MKQMNRRTWGQWAAGLLGAPVLGSLPACGGSDNDSDASVRVVNGSAGYASLDVYLDSTEVATAIGYGTACGYIATDAGSHTIAVTTAGSTTAVLSQSRTFGQDAPMTVVTHGWAGALKAFALTDTESAAASGYTKVLVYNTAADAGNVDVYLGGSDDDVADATAVAYAVSGGSSYSGGYVSVPAGTYRVRVTSSTDTTDVRLDTTGLVLGSTQVVCLVVTPCSSGTLVNAIAIIQGGTVTSLPNPLARLRVVAAVTSGSKVSADAGGTTLLDNVTAPTIGSYVDLTAAATSISLVVAGTTTSVTRTLAAGVDYTLLVWGDAGDPQTTWITDDNRLPTSSSVVKMRLLNGMVESAALSLAADYSSVVDNLAQGQASSFVTLNDASLNDLQVTASSATLYDSLKAGVTMVTLAAQGLYTVFMFGTLASPLFLLRKER